MLAPAVLVYKTDDNSFATISEQGTVPQCRFYGVNAVGWSSGVTSDLLDIIFSMHAVGRQGSGGYL